MITKVFDILKWIFNAIKNLFKFIWKFLKSLYSIWLVAKSGLILAGVLLIYNYAEEIITTIKGYWDWINELLNFFDSIPTSP